MLSPCMVCFFFVFEFTPDYIHLTLLTCLAMHTHLFANVDAAFQIIVAVTFAI